MSEILQNTTTSDTLDILQIYSDYWPFEQTKRQALLSIVQVDLARFQVKLSKKQEKDLIGIHQKYVWLDRPAGRGVTAAEVRRVFRDIEKASKVYLRALNYGLPVRFNTEELLKSIKTQVKSLIQIAENVKGSCSEEAIRKREKTYRETYGIPYRKPRKPWLHDYVKGMAWWYQMVTKKEPKAGTDSVFPAFIRNCLDVVEKQSGISDAIIRTALDAYKKEKSALGRSKKKC